MFVDSRESGRRYFLEVWKKYRAGVPMETLENLVLGVILDHPEYHTLLEQDSGVLEQEYTPAMGVTNPFLHMGLHIAIREQVSANRPPGIAGIYKTLLSTCGSAHPAEHRMMECLGEALWVAQRQNALPDENTYLADLRRLL